MQTPAPPVGGFVAARRTAQAFVWALAALFLAGCAVGRRVAGWVGAAPDPVPAPSPVRPPPPPGPPERPEGWSDRGSPDLGPVVPPPPPGAPGPLFPPLGARPFAGVPEEHLEPPDPVGPTGSTAAATPRVELPPMPTGPRVVYLAGSDPDLVALPSSVLVEPARPWTVIVLHHSATARGSVAVFDPMHRARGWEGVGYDFVIGNGTDTGDGEIEVTFRWREQKDGAHAKGWNDVAIGVCLVGNYEDAPPTPRQQEALVRLLRHLRRRFGIPPERIVGHRTLNPTLCPGRFFPLEAVLRASAP